MPAARLASISRSRWNSNSSLNSASIRAAPNQERSSTVRRCQIRISRRSQQQCDCRRQALPAGLFPFQVLATGSGQAIETGPTIVVGHPPRGRDPTVTFQTLQGRIQRALLQLEDIVRQLLDPLGDGPSVQRLQRNGLEYQEIHGALHEVDRLAHSVTPYDSRQEDGSNYCRLSRGVVLERSAP